MKDMCDFALYDNQTPYFRMHTSFFWLRIWTVFPSIVLVNSTYYYAWKCCLGTQLTRVWKRTRVCIWVWQLTGAHLLEKAILHWAGLLAFTALLLTSVCVCVGACLWVCVKGKGPPGVARALSCQLKLAAAACVSPNNKLQCLEASYSRPLHTPQRPLSCCCALRGRCSYFPQAPREMRPIWKNLGKNHLHCIAFYLPQFYPAVMRIYEVTEVANARATNRPKHPSSSRAPHQRVWASTCMISQYSSWVINI